MSERHQIRINLPEKLFRELEARADEVGCTVPVYALLLLNRNADARTNYMAHQAATWSMLVAMMNFHQYQFPGLELTARHLDHISRSIEGLLGDSPEPPDKLLSIGRDSSGTLFGEIARVYGRFVASETRLDKGEKPWGGYCGSCRRNYYS